jgi:hypothetical protein
MKPLAFHLLLLFSSLTLAEQLQSCPWTDYAVEYNNNTQLHHYVIRNATQCQDALRINATQIRVPPGTSAGFI